MSFIKKRNNEKQIVFVSTHFLKPRILKMAYALSEKGYEINLFYNKVVNSKFKIEDYPYFHKAYGYGYHTQWLCLLRMMTFSPLIFHVFSEACYNEFAHRIVSVRKYLGKIVYDEYDMTVDRSINADKTQIYDERYCIENADGVCSRSYELEYLKKEKGYHVKKDIRFFDYCWNGIGNKSDNKNLLNGFVYAGGIYSEDFYLGCCYKEIVEALKGKKIQYHIYPAGISDRMRKYLCELEKKEETFQLMKPVKQEKLIEKMSHYMAGAILYREGWGKEDAEESKEVNRSMQISYNEAGTNEFFDCVDAGLPIISDCCIKLLGMFEQYGIVYRTNSSRLSDDLNDILNKLPEMRKNVAQCRNEFDVKKQISRLVEFYKKL